MLQKASGALLDMALRETPPRAGATGSSEGRDVVLSETLHA